MNVLEEALQVVTGPRRQSYGEPLASCQALAQVWTALFADLLKPGCEFEPRHVVLGLLALKLCREAHRHQRDNVVDIAGYAWVLEQVTDDAAAAGG